MEGNVLQILDLGDGASVGFPMGLHTSALGFEYKADTNWQLDLDGFIIDLPADTSGFVGVVLTDSAIREFTLSTSAGSEGFLWIDDLTVAGLSPTPTPYYGTPTPDISSYLTRTPTAAVFD
jgi:hypothetical protein